MLTIFLLCGVAFFLAQAGTLLWLLVRRLSPDLPESLRHVEIVWTLVPAAVLVALVLMLSSRPDGNAARTRGGSDQLALEPGGHRPALELDQRQPHPAERR